MIEVLETLLTLLVCWCLFVVSRLWWKSHLNPVALGVLAWTPALVMLNWPPYFLSPVYIHLNRPIYSLTYVALAIAFLSFWAGCAVVKAVSKPLAFEVVPARLALRADPARMLAVFAIGLGIFLYAYVQSGLMNVSELDQMEVAESRLAIHIGPISFLIGFMDIAAIGFFARFLQTGRWPNLIPMLVVMAAYVAILQKSPVVWMVSAAIFIAALHPRSAYYFLWRNAARRLATIAFGSMILVALFQINSARGISDVELTASTSRVTEQTYIYSGASAIMNLSVTLEGYLPSNPPVYGAYLARPILWYTTDRSMFDSGRYFEGINGATYLNNAWLDFRWYGFFITPFLTGIFVMLFIRASLSGYLAGMVCGAVATRAVIFSEATDIIFDPTVWITLGLALVADLVVRRRPQWQPQTMVAPRPDVGTQVPPVGQRA
jgi:hypothetical protein